MAGIGFALERLYRSNSLTDRMASFAHASIVAAGPCLLAVLCIWLISLTTAEQEGRTTVAAFRAIIIYSFALSFVVTAPIALVSARVMSDRLHDGEVAAVSAISLSAFALSSVITVLVAAALFGFAAELEAAAAAAAVANCALIALIWVACLFCSVTRDYTYITASFAVGMMLAVVAVTIGYRLRPDLDVMLWAFNLGLGATLFGLLTRIIFTFPFAITRIVPPARALLRAS